MDRNIAQDYVNYRIGEGWTLLQIARVHQIPGQYRGCYSETYVVDYLARQHEQLDR